MRFNAGVAAAALSGLAIGATAQSPPKTADVYLLLSKTYWNEKPWQPAVPKEVARHIFLSRASCPTKKPLPCPSRYGSDLRDIPDTVDIEDAVEYIAKFGKQADGLLMEGWPEKTPSQLVMILEGITPEMSAKIAEAMDGAGIYQRPAFTIADPPSAKANERLIESFQNMGVALQTQCQLQNAVNPWDSSCWTGPTSIVKYDQDKNPLVGPGLLYNLDRIAKFVHDGDLDVMLVLMPESSRRSKLDHWSSAAAGSAQNDLRRRSSDSETVIADDFVGMPTKTPTAKAAAAPKKRAQAIPQCFASVSACMTTTGNCSGHGECVNKYSQNDPKKCFSCRCEKTIISHGNETGSRGRKTQAWGGSTCQKEDISVPFWMLTSLTIVLIGAITFCIGLLFSVGEEKLPGVIGAGVSRNK
ncbi:hypothetical protein B0H67DRAFT_486759 [Lasiosphaeris hirsuta]|uniref:Vacuolar sorting protein Vps3844 C-terminal domain-containing protein n=1 Tax=Lasiosphaeris hirsuta TaxID=260670 RepID=A0AA40E1H3_9PEZI|nr:hypothetical protein B0H67DRAFT_486759 [Lasiosphaeris hirsuta]